MRVLVTGSEGFIGKRLVPELHVKGHEVTRWDRTLDPKLMDLVSPQGLRYALSACDAVVHLAANADVRGGWSDPTKDLHVNVVATHNLLEAMRKTETRRLVFASSAAVYGEGKGRRQDVPGWPKPVIPVRETWHAKQTSLYGASKLAAEAFIGAYVEAGHLSASVLRFVSLLGPGYAHGHVVDFVKRLREDPTSLEILGFGTTERSYVDVDDAVQAICLVLEGDPGWEVLNVGTDHTLTSKDSARLICDYLGVDPEFSFTGESWRGDHDILLDATQLRKRGWSPRYTIRESLTRTLEAL